MAARRKGFLLVNSSPGVYVIDASRKTEFDQLRSQGWRIARIRPICTSLEVKLRNLPPEILRQHAYAYSFCILEKKDGVDG